MTMQADQTTGEITATPATQSAAIVPSAQATLDSYRRGLEPNDIQQAFVIAQTLAKTRLFGITSPEDAIARIMTGRELGLTTMQSVRGVYSFDGKVGLYAAVMHALCLQAPECEGFYCVFESDEKVTYCVKRKGQPPREISWTIEDAARAKLLAKGDDSNWHKYPRRMLHARCKADGAREVFPERMFGMLSREEMLDGTAIDVPHAPVSVDSAPSVAMPIQNAEAELLGRIEKASTDAEKKAVRAAIKAAIDAGDLVGPAVDQVRGAYNAKFPTTKRAEPAQAPPPAPASDPQIRQPGEEG